MFNFWFLLVLLIGVIGLFIIINRNWSKLNNTSDDTNSEKEILKKFKFDFDLEKFEKKTLAIFEKILRRVRVLVLRLDTNVTRSLNSLRHKREEANLKDFSVTELDTYEIKTDEKTISILETHYLESVNSNPNIETYLKLAELYLKNQDFNSCRAMLINVWKTDKQNEKLNHLISELQTIQKENILS